MRVRLPPRPVLYNMNITLGVNQTTHTAGICVREKIVLSWSSGKDSAMMLYEIQQSGKYEVASLLTTVTENYDRVSMHGVRSRLLDKQAESLGLPLHKIYLSTKSSNEEYEAKMKESLAQFRENGVSSVAFGDIFLEDLKKYREDNLAKISMKGLFPIWKKDTKTLIREFIRHGFQAVIVCVDTNVLDKSWAGRMIDSDFLSQLPSNIDPCGENGEFHTFAFDGPIFKRKISFSIGEKVMRDSRFYFVDLIPKD